MTARKDINIRFNTSAEMSRAVFELINKILFNEIIDEDIKRKFILAIGEALDNAVIHGNKFSPDKFIEIEYVSDSSKISFTVSDEGEGFDYPRHLEIPLMEFEAPKLIEKTVKYGSPGGLGLALIRKCSNKVVFAPPGNKITIIKYLS
jgi:serine/threonine-protein kinase RsbW